MKIKFKTIDEYISYQPEKIASLLNELRDIIHKAAPKSNEVISYNMPAFRGNHVLVYFAAYKNHIGFYPTSEPIITFANDLKLFKTSKGAIQLPLDKALPKDLIEKIVAYRVNADQTKNKKRRKINIKKDL